MKRKKVKITIESEGHPTQVIEANGIAAALLTDGMDSEHYGLKCLICGTMSGEDLLRIRDGVEDELMDALNGAIINNMYPIDLLKILAGGNKNESER